MTDCLFCKIIAGEIPCNKLFENNRVIAFLDISPVNPGHTLVVSKLHSENILDTPESELKEMIVVTKKLIPSILDTVKADAFNIHINNNKTAGQAIPHIHFHIIPRFENDGRKLWKGRDYKEGEAEEILNKIKDTN